MNNPLIVGIKEMYKNSHPFPQLPFFKLVSFEDKDILKSADIFVQNNIIDKGRKHKKIYYQKNILSMCRIVLFSLFVLSKLKHKSSKKLILSNSFFEFWF